MLPRVEAFRNADIQMERRSGAPFGNFKTDARKAGSVPQKAKNAFRGFHERGGGVKL